MRSLMSRLKGLTELLLLTLLLMVGLGSNEALAQWFTSPGGGSGGFTGRPLITVELYVNDNQTSTSVPVNLAGVGPNPSLPYTRTLTAVVRQDGRLFPTNIQLDLAPTLASGALFDPEDLTQGFRSLPLESTSGIATAFFHASSTPGNVVITASAQDPNTGQTVSASISITVVDEKRPPAAITFTGAYVNAVIAGQSQFGGAETLIQNGSYSRVVSVVVNDSNGNPTNPNTQINFYLIDAPITGYPSTPGSFFIAGGDGNPVDGQFQFNAVGGDFIVKGVTPFQRLVLGKPIPDLRIIESVLSATSLAVQSTHRAPFPANTSNVPYVIGSAQNAAILSPSFTDLNGVAGTILTYPVERIGQTAVLVACTVDMSVCGILNTCDVNGANCKSVYLGVTNGTDRTLTVSATTLGPNRSTDVQMCLRDVNFTPLPATEIRYDIGTKGPAKVTINDVEGTPGKVLTGENGCAVVEIASGGQIPGGLPIELQFTSDYVAEPATVTIKSPGAGKMDGLFNCSLISTDGTGQCDGTLRLTDDEGSPMAGVLIAVGQVVAPGEFTLTFNPAEGVFGKTDDSGQLRVSVEMKSPGAYTFPFQTASGGTATFTLNATVTAPGVLAVTLNGPTEAQLDLPFSAVLQATGGVPPYAWSLTSGSLPPGLRLSGTGAISGTPTQEGAFSFAVQVKDKNDLTGFGAFTITVGKQPELTLTLEPTIGAVNVPYNGVVSATGGTEPYSFALLAGSLPPGLALDGNGTLSGTPTAVGTFAFSVKASDSKGATGTGNFSLTINSASPLTVTLEGGGSGTVGANFSGVVTAAGGTTPYTFKVLAGSLPGGVTLSTGGTLSGKPTVAGVFVATLEATDKNGLKGTGTITITINSVDAPTIATESPLPDAALKNFYTVIFTATGGVLPHTWSLEAPSTLPPGFVPGSLNAATGALAGTPTTAGNYNFIIKVTDATGAVAIKSFALKVGDGGSGPITGSLTLVASSPQLRSSGTPPVTLTATVRDVNNAVIEGKTVQILSELAPSPPAPTNCNSTSYQLQFTRNVTDAAGTAEALLTTGGDPTSRCIGLIAVVDNVESAPVTWIQVTGTEIQITGPDTAVLNQSTPLVLTVKLVDADGNALANQSLTASSTPPGRVTPTNLTTGANGQVQVTVTTTQSGVVTVTVSGAGAASATKTITISSDQFVFTVPSQTPDPVTNQPVVPQIPLNTDSAVTVQWLKEGVPQNGPVSFTLTRGVFTATGTSSQTVNAVNGLAQTVIRADNAGPSAITATTNTGLFAQAQVQFVATTPSRMTVQATPAVIGANPAGSTGEQAVISVVLRDDNNNLVANQTVNFTLIDVSGGSLAPSSAVTSLLGETAATYTSSAAPSAQNGVAVLATVAGPPIAGFSCTAPSAVPASTIQGLVPSPLPDNTCLVAFTVAEKQLFIKLGTGNKIEELSPTQYAFPYNVLITDAAGRPIKDATVELVLWPSAFYRGRYCFNEGLKPKWSQLVTSGPYANEDINRNGILDPGEDGATGYPPVGNPFNNLLNPGNVATVTPSTVKTGDDGSVAFNIIYAKEFAQWVDVELSARAKVSGSEATDVAEFNLPILFADLDSDAGPAGNPSPFGVDSTPSCDNPNPLTIEPNQLAVATLNQAYTATLTAAGGNGTTVSWSVVSGNLPTGLTIDFFTGVISGTPTAAGSYTFTIRAANTGGFGERTYILNI